MKKLIYLVVSLFIIQSCAEEVEEIQESKPEWTKEESINMQSAFSAEEEEEINSYLKRHSDWKMTKTGTGLRYFIYDKSEFNDTVKVNNEVTVDFDIKLLDGTECYSSSINGAESFIVEKTDIESGLHEAVKFMCTGDKALFILPSHLAHGLIGDQDKIPPMQAIIYDIHLLKIKR